MGVTAETTATPVATIVGVLAAWLIFSAGIFAGQKLVPGTGFEPVCLLGLRGLSSTSLCPGWFVTVRTALVTWLLYPWERARIGVNCNYR